MKLSCRHASDSVGRRICEGWINTDTDWYWYPQGVNPGQERGLGVVLCKLWTLVAFVTAAMGAICSTTVPVGTWLHWSTDSPACMGRMRQDGQCCGREAQCGRRTKINWTNTAHNTRICICICGHLGLVPIHTHTHAYTVVWIRVEHWAYWQPQLVVAEKSVTPRQPTTTTTTTMLVSSGSFISWLFQ